MSKVEIRVGQEWQEQAYNQRLAVVDDLVMHADGSLFAVRLRVIKGKGRPATQVQEYVLRSAWRLTKEAPNAPVRAIRLPILQATATHCNDGREACGSYLSHSEECGAFGGVALEYDEAVGAFSRLPQCIAAEIPTRSQ